MNMKFLFFFFLFFHFFFFIFLFFAFFFISKKEATPLFVAAQKGHEQIVQLLLEKGNPNVDFAVMVLLFLLLFF